MEEVAFVSGLERGGLQPSRAEKCFCDDLDCRRHGVKTVKWGNLLLQMSNVKIIPLPKI